MNSLDATDNYLNLLLSLPNIDSMTVLSVFFLTLSRILPLMALVPFLGAKNVPMMVRMMFAIALVAIFLPQNMLHIHENIGFEMTFVGLMVKELLIGTILAIFASAPFFIAQMSGSLIDHSRGSSSLQINDPTTQTQAGSIGVFYNYVLIATFFFLNGPAYFFDALGDSFMMLPIDGSINPSFFNMNIPVWQQIFSFAAFLFKLTVQLAAPALIGLLLTDLFLGIANRLAPQVQIVFLGLSLKSWVGIALLTASWALIIQVMGKEAIGMMKMLNQIIQQVGAFR